MAPDTQSQRVANNTRYAGAHFTDAHGGQSQQVRSGHSEHRIQGWVGDRGGQAVSSGSGRSGSHKDAAGSGQRHISYQHQLNGGQQSTGSSVRNGSQTHSGNSNAQHNAYSRYYSGNQQSDGSHRGNAQLHGGSWSYLDLLRQNGMHSCPCESATGSSLTIAENLQDTTPSRRHDGSSTGANSSGRSR